MSETINELYGKILKSTKEIKQSVMLELASFTPLLSQLPQEVVKELDYLATIDGYVTELLTKRGISFTEIEGKENYISVKVGDDTYIISKEKLPSNKKEIIKEEQPVLQEESVSEQIEISNSTKEEKKEITIKNKTEEDIIVENTSSNIDEPISEIITEDKIFINEEDEVVIEKFEEKEPELPQAPLQATIIGGDYTQAPPVAPIFRADIFTEEKRKNINEFVFDSYRLSVCHIGSRPEDMQVMIAPLKIQKYFCTTVPIIVSIYYKGKLYTASSFDKNEDGKNLVEIEVNEYYFLCRGSFNDNGEFQSSIVTTGISANQGDILNIASQKKHHPTGPNIKNGHLKFRYTGEDGPGIIDIFPLELNEKDFIMMTRCGEFVDYIPISNSAHGLSRALLYDCGIKSEIVCAWDNDYLEAEIVPI